MANITVIATIIAEPGSEAALAEVLLGLVAPTRQEDGCIRYDLHRDPADPGTLVFLETWSSREAHLAHLKTPHFLEAKGRQVGLVKHKEVRFVEQI